MIHVAPKRQRGDSLSARARVLIWAVILLSCFTFWSVVIGWGVTQAAGAPAAPTAAITLHDEVSIEVDAARTQAWLEAILKTKISPRTVVVAEDLGHPSWDGEFNAVTDTIKIRPNVAADLRYRAARGRWKGRYVVHPPALLIHELLHRKDTRACWSWRKDGVDLEEWPTDALTHDLIPAWGWRFWRERIVGWMGYPEGVRYVRAASARATGSPTWRTREAALWRRALWAADCTTREQMLTNPQATRERTP